MLSIMEMQMNLFNGVIFLKSEKKLVNEEFSSFSTYITQIIQLQSANLRKSLSMY